MVGQKPTQKEFEGWNPLKPVKFGGSLLCLIESMFSMGQKPNNKKDLKGGIGGASIFSGGTTSRKGIPAGGFYWELRKGST